MGFGQAHPILFGALGFVPPALCWHRAAQGQERGCGVCPGDPEAERGWPCCHPARHIPFSPVFGRNHAKPQGFDATQGRKVSSAWHGKKNPNVSLCHQSPPPQVRLNLGVLPQTLRVWGRKGLIWDPCGSWPSQREVPWLLWDAQPQDCSAGTSWAAQGAGIDRTCSCGGKTR